MGAGLGGLRSMAMGGLVSVRRPAGGRAWRALQERDWNECLDGYAKERLLIPPVSRTQSSLGLLVNLTGSTGAWFLSLKLSSQRFQMAKTSCIHFGLIF